MKAQQLFVWLYICSCRCCINLHCFAALFIGFNESQAETDAAVLCRSADGVPHLQHVVFMSALQTAKVSMHPASQSPNQTDLLISHWKVVQHLDCHSFCGVASMWSVLAARQQSTATTTGDTCFQPRRAVPDQSLIKLDSALSYSHVHHVAPMPGSCS